MQILRRHISYSILLILLCTYNTNSQVPVKSFLSDDDLQVLSLMKEKITNSELFIIVDHPDTGIWIRTENLIGKNSLKGWDTAKIIHRIRISKQDREKLKNQIREAKVFIYPDSLLNGTSAISNDSIWSFLKKKNEEFRQKIEIAIKAGDREYLMNHKHSYYWAIAFSKPIYFENNNYCIAGFHAFCNISAGWNQTAVFRKDGKTWSYFLTLEQGAY